MITPLHLTSIVPEMPIVVADKYAPFLEKYMAKFAINTATRVAYFMAQVLEETGGFKATVENLNYSAPRLQQMAAKAGGKWKNFADQAFAVQYANQPQKLANFVYSDRYGNGSVASGDGYRYRGRGIMQLTWKGNYAAASKAIYGDDRLVRNPDQIASDPETSVATACWFWYNAGCNQLADKNDFTAAVKKVNGGTLNMDKRLAFLQKVQSALNTVKKKVADSTPS